ncbi:MAG: aminomethyltransferase family protein, partial [Pseudomonadota bacterium]
RLKARGAVFEEVFGWERPRFFAREGVAQHDHYGFTRTAWHDAVGAECRSVQEAAGIMDISAFTKVEVAGPGAAAFLEGLIPNRLPSQPGRIALTHLLTDRGRIELETTVVRLAEDRFYLVCAAFFEQRLMDYLGHRAPEGVTLTNRSSAWGALALNGPRAREILGQCTPAPLDNGAFPWLRAQEISIAGQSVWAFRMSYAGELGWEFHMEAGAMLPVYDALMAAGAPLGLSDYGSFAMNAMRMEKAFKGAGELTNEVTLAEADVLRFVRKEKSFPGSVETQEAPRFLCAYLEIDGDGVHDGHGGEAVFVGARQIGLTASVAFGHRVGKLLAFAFLAPEHASPGTELEVMVMGSRRPARILAEPAYDPANALPRTEAAPLAAE